MRYPIYTLLLCILFSHWTLAQQSEFTRQDTLRGSITPERAWWDLIHYDLEIKVDIEAKTFSGKNTVTYQVLNEDSIMQIDLQEPMKIQSITQDGQSLKYQQDGNAWFIRLYKAQKIGDLNAVSISYEGQPKISKRPPWSGGVTWSKDANEKDFIATACQGDGASLWWPCKDHMYDETDSMTMRITVPQHLMDVSNGRLRQVIENEDSTKTYVWFTANPINNYGVNINIGDYVHFGEVYQGENGPLDCDYYVLRDNLSKAQVQFEQVPKMLEAFEHWFGPYPFYEDSYKLVEVPYLGMEHQSSVTYGNKYQNGYLGMDMSGTGWGLKFDYIIIHESGHEWFANNITYKDIADMWIHESFTTYSESIYLEYHFGKEAGADYVIGLKGGIQNKTPIIGNYDVNDEGSGDMYSKGANMLHTLRQLVNDDDKWRNILREMNSTFYHQTVTTAQIEDFLSGKTGVQLQSFFDQYLRDKRVPLLEYKIIGKELSYRWTNSIDGFDMPIEITLNGESMILKPNNTWQKKHHSSLINFIEVDRDYYVESKLVK